LDIGLQTGLHILLHPVQLRLQRLLRMGNHALDVLNIVLEICLYFLPKFLQARLDGLRQ